MRLKGREDTDLTFSIKGIGAIPCTGSSNIPDGEVFSAPVRDSVNGVIHFNAPTIYRGVTHNDIRLTFKNGRDRRSHQQALTKQLRTRCSIQMKAPRYVGELPRSGLIRIALSR